MNYTPLFFPSCASGMHAPLCGLTAVVVGSGASGFPDRLMWARGLGLFSAELIAESKILRSLGLLSPHIRSQPSDNRFHGRAENAADAQQGTQSDRLAGLDPLPVTDGIAKGNHVLLAVAGAFAQYLDAASQAGKEFVRDFDVVGHARMLYGLDTDLTTVYLDRGIIEVILHNESSASAHQFFPSVSAGAVAPE